MAKAQSITMCVQVAEQRHLLLAIEASESPEAKELSPLRLMTETLD